MNKNFTSKLALPSMTLSEVICFNSNIKVDSKPVTFSFFSDKNLKFVGQLFNNNVNIKTWKDLKTEFHFKDNHKIQRRIQRVTWGVRPPFFCNHLFFFTVTLKD